MTEFRIPERTGFTAAEKNAIIFSTVSSAVICFACILVQVLYGYQVFCRNSVVTFEPNYGFSVKRLWPRGLRIPLSEMGVKDGYDGHGQIMGRFMFELNESLGRVSEAERTAILAALTLLIRQGKSSKVLDFLKTFSREGKMPAYIRFRTVGT